MSTYIPRSDDGSVMQIAPLKPTLAVTVDSTISSETEVTLQSGTTYVEIHAVSYPILVKFKTATGGTAVSTSSWDLMVQAGQTRSVQVPYASGGTRCGVFAFIDGISGSAATLYLAEY